MEQAMRKAHGGLELRVAERTDRLAQANRDLLAEIAERKETERQLQDSRQLLENVA